MSPRQARAYVREYYPKRTLWCLIRQRCRDLRRPSHHCRTLDGTPTLANVFQHIDAALHSILRAAVPSDADVSIAPPDRPWADLGGSDPGIVYAFLHRVVASAESMLGSWIDRRDSNGRVVSRQPAPRYFLCAYLVTAWAPSSEQEHALLGQALAALAAQDTIPRDLAGPLGDPAFTIRLAVAEPSMPAASPETFTAFDIPARSYFDVVVTAPLVPSAITSLPTQPGRVDLGLGRGTPASGEPLGPSEVRRHQPG